jgi:hypothetical protein
LRPHQRHLAHAPAGSGKWRCQMLGIIAVTVVDIAGLVALILLAGKLMVG